MDVGFPLFEVSNYLIRNMKEGDDDEYCTKNATS